MTDQRIRGATYDGHRIWYRIAGSGPALVLVRQNRVPADDRQLELLSDRFTVLQVTPIGFGSCERPAGYRPSGRIAPHILAAINQEGIDRFAVWGYSQGAAMAAVVAQATTRAVAMVAGGNPLIGVPTPGTLRRLDREARLPVGSTCVLALVRQPRLGSRTKGYGVHEDRLFRVRRQAIPPAASPTANRERSRCP